MSKLFWQIFKYGVIGVASTLVQTGVFYTLATTYLKCLTTDDFAVRLLGFAAAEGLTDGVRAFRFAFATGVGFVLANVFCWLLNRRYVFTSGRYRWSVEFALFFATASIATVVALSISSMLIGRFGLMTTLAVFVEVIASFVINFVVRKFVIFKG